MSLILTQTFQDTFVRANENPLSDGGQWTSVSPTHHLEVVSNLCQGVVFGFNTSANTGGTSANDQYCSFTLAAFSNPDGDVAYLYVRWNTGQPVYELDVTGVGANQDVLVVYNGQTLLDISGVNVALGDVFTLAVVGTTLYALQNGIQIGSVTNSSLASGQTALGAFTLPPDVQFSNFASGTAALGTTYSISGNAGVAFATVSWSGTSTGSTIADGSGNYSVTGLGAGNYTITPSLSGYTFSPKSRNETITSSNITGVNFSATPSSTVGPTAALSPRYGPRPVQIFGQISSGAHSGAIAAVATDANGNLAISGGSGGSINSIDVLGAIADAIPVMIMGAVSGLTVPGSTALFGVNCDQYGNLLCSIGTGGGNSYPSLDTPTANSEGAVPIQIFGRIPSSGLLVGVPCSTSGALGNNINAISGISPNTIDVADNGTLVPVVLVARIATGYPNAGKLVIVSLDQYGCLCVAGSSGSSTTPSAVLSVMNGVPVPVQLYQRDANNQLTSVPLTSSGSLSLN